jgi:hypothetical protein
MHRWWRIWSVGWDNQTRHPGIQRGKPNCRVVAIFAVLSWKQKNNTQTKFQQTPSWIWRPWRVVECFAVFSRFKRGSVENKKKPIVLNDPSTKFSCISSKFAGATLHSKASLKMHHPNCASTHWVKMCYVFSYWPHNLHSVGPFQFFLSSWSADWILLLHTCHRNILIFKGSLAFQIFIIHLLGTPGKVSSL